MSERQWMLTTTDNPINPFEDWFGWYLEDLKLGYDTCGLLARTSAASNSINDEEDLFAMREVVEHNWSGVHILVTRDTFDELIRS